VLDGVYAQEGRLIFMTTNCVDKLDKALIRPGRVDFTMRFGIAEWEQTRDLYLQFYSPAVSSVTAKPRLPEGVTREQLEKLALKFADEVEETLLKNTELEPVKKTACTVQNLLMLHARRDPFAAHRAVQAFVRGLLEKQRSESGLPLDEERLVDDEDDAVEMIKSGNSVIPFHAEVLAAHRRPIVDVSKGQRAAAMVAGNAAEAPPTKGTTGR